MGFWTIHHSLINLMSDLFSNRVMRYMLERTSNSNDLIGDSYLNESLLDIIK